jgi:CheY-like chemotaxis protein
VKAPTRALIVEDIETWVYTLDRAARRAGASEVVVCENLQAVKDALRKARFDVAILDVGLDPDDDLNSDGIKALEAIREKDGGSTRCVMITGWQGGDVLDLQADAQHRLGMDWAYMKDKYEAHTVIVKLSELLEQAPERRCPRPRRWRTSARTWPRSASRPSCSPRFPRPAACRPSIRWCPDS